MTSSSTSSSSLVDRINALLREDASGRVVSVESLPGERERYERRLRAFRYAVTRERDAEGDCDAPSSSEAAMAVELDALEETTRFWRALAEDETNATRALMSSPKSSEAPEASAISRRLSSQVELRQCHGCFPSRACAVSGGALQSMYGFGAPGMSYAK